MFLPLFAFPVSGLRGKSAQKAPYSDSVCAAVHTASVLGAHLRPPCPRTAINAEVNLGEIMSLSNSHHSLNKLLHRVTVAHVFCALR